jgi:hypothetical protein
MESTDDSADRSKANNVLPKLFSRDVGRMQRCIREGNVILIEVVAKGYFSTESITPILYVNLVDFIV